MLVFKHNGKCNSNHQSKCSKDNLHKMVVTKQTPFCHVSLRESGFSKRYKAMVIAVERDNDFMLNPSANIVFEENDVVWFVGSRAIV